MRFLARTTAIAAVALTAAAPLAAQRIDVVNYTTTSPEGQAQGGLFNYFDETGRQLIDGVLGVGDWQQNLGNGAAYEWVAWRIAEPVISLNLGGSFNVSSVRLGLNNFISGGVFQPTSVSINGTSYGLSGLEIAAGTRGWLTFSQPMTASQIDIRLSDDDTNRWIFADEIEVYGTSTVPEPMSLAMVGVGLLGVGAAAHRRRQR